MTDTEKKIAEIRETLEKATPEPWKALDSCKGILWKYVQTNNGVITDNIRWQDAELIANAPEWLRFLLDEREKMIEWIKFALVGAMKESCRHETPDPTWHCCDWAELVEKAREIGVTVE